MRYNITTTIFQYQGDAMKPETSSGSQMMRQHKSTMFRELFRIPENFLQLLDHCYGGSSNLTVDDIAPFDLESNLARSIKA